MPLRFPAGLLLALATCMASPPARCAEPDVAASAPAPPAIPRPWFGTYGGPGHGVTISRNGTFVLERTCHPHPDNDYPLSGAANGDVAMQGAWMILSVRGSDGRCPFEASYRFVVRRIGRALFLFSPADLQELVNQINLGGQGNAAGMLSRGKVDQGHGDPFVKVERTFDFPDEYRARLLDKPVEAAIVKIGPVVTDEVHQTARIGVEARDGIRHVAHITLDQGTNAGLFADTQLYSELGWITLTRASADTAEADVTWWQPKPGPHIGMPVFSTYAIRVQNLTQPLPGEQVFDFELTHCIQYGGVLVRMAPGGSQRWGCGGFP